VEGIVTFNKNPIRYTHKTRISQQEVTPTPHQGKKNMHSWQYELLAISRYQDFRRILLKVTMRSIRD
jgi:hypothetical protein